MVLNVQDFKAQLINGGARSNLFSVTLNMPGNNQNLTKVSQFLVKTAEIPGSTITPIIIPFRGRQLKISGDRTFDPWNVTVINDGNMQIRKAMETWMNAMNNHADNQGATDGYFAQLEVAQIDRNTGLVIPDQKWTFVDAWPSDLGPISVSFDNENQIQEYQITFQYQYWVSDRTDSRSNGGFSASFSAEFNR